VAPLHPSCLEGQLW